MKIALLSDIHGNAHALRAVLKAAAVENAEQLYVAGDFVGYYYEPAEVLGLLAGWRWCGVKGNHEDMLQSWIEGRDRDAIRRRYGAGIETAAAQLSREQIAALLALPRRREETANGRRALICHGTPWHPDEYAYPDAPQETRERMFGEGQDLVVFGHTHYPVVWERDGRVAANPGSVGQPRDRKPGASWALWDTAGNTVSLRHETYDAAPVLAQAAARDPDLSFLRDVLTRTA